MSERVKIYIDGFNLYFGMKSKGWNSLLWLDLQKLSQNLLKTGQQLTGVNYFTSRVRNNPEKEKRQNTYFEALEVSGGVNFQYGRFQPNTIQCRFCGRSYSSPNEKMTDVNIAVEMLSDVFEDKVDTVILVSGDSDLIPPIRKILSAFPGKKVVVAFPPARHNLSLQKIASSSFIIGRKKLKDCQLPPTVQKLDGFVLRKPEKWNQNLNQRHQGRFGNT